jgi:hypothetical protein
MIMGETKIRQTYRPRAAALMLLATLSIAMADEIPGWFKAGSRPSDYSMGVDRNVLVAGKSSGYIKSIVPDAPGFGTYMQTFQAGEYRGKRVQFSAQVKSDNVVDWAGLWMRVDGEGKSGIAFDNMQNRPIKGTRDWTRCTVVLDVDAKAEAIAFGILLAGKGAVWLNDVRFETVGPEVPVTDMRKQQPNGPRNLGFDQK